MATVSRYECDGPGCVDTAPKAKGHQYPDLMLWNRLTIHTPQGTKVGAFHAPACMVRWVAVQFGIGNGITTAEDLKSPHCSQIIERDGAPDICGYALSGDGVCTAPDGAEHVQSSLAWGMLASD